MEVYVGNFMSIVIPTSKAQIDHVANAIMRGNHDVFPADIINSNDPILESCGSQAADAKAVPLLPRRYCHRHRAAAAAKLLLPPPPPRQTGTAVLPPLPSPPWTSYSNCHHAAATAAKGWRYGIKIGQRL